MKLEYFTKRSKTTAQRRLLIEGRPSDKNTIVSILLKAGAAALLPVVLKLIILAGQQLLTNMAH